MFTVILHYIVLRYYSKIKC